MIANCEQLPGRMRDICRGHDSAGFALEMTPAKRLKYVHRFLKDNTLVLPELPDGLQRRKKEPAAKPCCGKKSVTRRVVSLAKTLASWAADGLRFASEKERDERREICGGCPLNDNEWCRGCGCHLKEKTALRVSYCPTGKWFVEQPVRPVHPQRNLMMHIMPVAGNGIWQWNVRELLKRIDQFDGKRVVAIVTPGKSRENLDSVEDVKAVFGSHRIDEWIVKRNVTKQREVVTWPLLLAALQSEPGITFACHAKGVTHTMDSIVVRWGQAMWETCLDDPASVERALSQYSIAGPFKRYGMFKTAGNNRWHYSGTFYWFRNDDVFAKDWRKIDKPFFGAESWPGKHFKSEEAACLFCDDSPDLYKGAHWDSRVSGELEEWRMARGNHH